MDFRNLLGSNLDAEKDLQPSMIMHSFRPIELSDAPWIFSSLGQKSVAENTSGIPHPLTRRFVESWIKDWINFEAENHGWRIVSYNAKGKGTGSAAIKTLSNDVGEVSFWVDPVYWRLGIASALCQKLIWQAKAQGFQSLTAGHFIGNIGSAMTLKKNGFIQTTGPIEVYSMARNATVQTERYRLEL